MGSLQVLLLVAILSVVQSAVPNTPRKSSPTDGTASTTLGAKKFAATNDCSGPVAFSDVGRRSTFDTVTPVAFLTALTDNGIGWNTEIGVFTCFCPGVYQFAFAVESPVKLALKKMPSNGSWNTVVVGNSHVVILDMEVGDKVALFHESGSLPKDTAAKPTMSFSGFRIAKKQ